MNGIEIVLMSIFIAIMLLVTVISLGFSNLYDKLNDLINELREH